jgi:hypothetical protein
MPDFELVPQPSLVFASQAWTDPATATKPSRVTDHLGRGRRAWTAYVNEPFEVWAKTLVGVAGEPDVDLAGRLYESWFAEAPVIVSPTYPVGYTSRVRCVVPLPGHCVLVVRRPLGGRVAIHIDVLDPANPVPP